MKKIANILADIASLIIKLRRQYFQEMVWYHVLNEDGTTYAIVQQIDTDGWWRKLVKIEDYIWRLRDRIDPGCRFHPNCMPF